LISTYRDIDAPFLLPQDQLYPVKRPKDLDPVPETRLPSP
jgi:hypothetical protein